MTEIWKPIPNYEGIYEASNMGRIRSVPGKITSNARYSRRCWETRVLKEKHPKAKKRQDARVSLWKDGKVKDHLVARLVAAAWHGVPAEGMTVNHINGDWKDNRPENLEWITLAENIRKGFEGGQYSSFCCPVSLIAEDGTKLTFRSQQTASLYLGRPAKYVGSVLSKGRFARSKDGVEYIVRREATA